MSYNHLNTFERGKIEALNKLRYSARSINNGVKIF